ncbi:PA14 domain-containing protein [Micromonospora sp. MS34]|uniref:PA14 domain-containing protein n=1 Tax=Micromonospora sp. MS34 TaxID=3385971 RepID=UPI0039A02181
MARHRRGLFATAAAAVALLFGAIALHGTAQAAAAPDGDGLKGKYFNNKTLSGSPSATRVDPVVNFGWGQSGPPGVGSENFSIRWSGMVLPEFDGIYTFHATTDDGVKLWVDGQPVIYRWAVQPATEIKGRVELKAGKKAYITMEYFEASGEASAKLEWSHANLPRQIVPQNRLFSVGDGSPVPPPRPAPPVSKYYKGKFAPPDGKALMVVGQDLGGIKGYVQGGLPAPGGTTTYCDIAEANQPYILYGCREDTVVDYGAGPVNAYDNLSDYPNSALVMGLYIVDNSGQNLNHIVDGTSDQYIDNLGKLFKDDGRPVYLRIGYEFDGPWNHYDPTGYQAAFKHIVDRFRARGVDNVAYVWQAATYVSTTNIEQWYPGDDYVDWTGVSYFQYFPAPYDQMLAFSRAHNKPMLVAESSPQGYDLDARTNFWNGKVTDEDIWYGWFDGFFNWVHENRDVVRAVAYINTEWNAQPMWGALWGDTRVEINPYVQNKWIEELNNPVMGWLNASPTLFDTLRKNSGPTTPPTTTPPTTTPPTTAPPTTPPAGDFTQGVDKTGDTAVTLWFKPQGFTPKFVVAHYKVDGGEQQNYFMTYFTARQRWERTVGNLGSGARIDYHLQYEKNGPQYETPWYSYTHR